MSLVHDESITYTKWPNYDPAKLVYSTVEIMVQVNGMLCGQFQAPKDAAGDNLQKQVMDKKK